MQIQVSRTFCVRIGWLNWKGSTGSAAVAAAGSARFSVEVDHVRQESIGREKRRTTG